MLKDWEEAFKERVSSVVFTDSDDLMFTGILSLPYSGNISHLICTFHLFDTNVKKWVQPVLTVTSGTSSWPTFRKKLSVVCEAQSEEKLERLLVQSPWWMVTRFNKNNFCSSVFASAYLGQKKTVGCCIFKTMFTNSASSTQRSESWHSLIKSYADISSLSTLFESLQKLATRRGLVKHHSWNERFRVIPLIQINRDPASIPLKVAVDLKLSRFCCSILKEELLSAYRM